MPERPRRRRAFAALALGLVLLAAILLPRLGARKPPPSAPEDWQVPDLLARLESRGLRFHVVPMSRATGDVTRGAYLCDGEQEWEDVAGLPADPSQAARWRGVVRVTAPSGPLAPTPDVVAAWGENGLRAGPFVFFGDAALLRRIAEALSE